MNSYPYGKYGIKKNEEDNKKIEYPRNELNNEEILMSYNRDRRDSVLVLEDGFSQLQYISDSSLFNTIKTIFDNFNVVEKDDINLETEEVKFKTQELIYKIESNMNSYPYGKFSN